YDAPAECPTEAAFRARILARTKRAELVAEGDTARAFQVRVTARGAAFLGRLEVKEGATVTARELAGASCEEVLEALAMTTALATDPNASMAAPKPAPPSPTALPSSPPREAPTNVRAPPTRTSLEVALDALVAGGVGNDLAVGGSLSVGLSHETRRIFA